MARSNPVSGDRVNSAAVFAGNASYTMSVWFRVPPGSTTDSYGCLCTATSNYGIFFENTATNLRMAYYSQSGNARDPGSIAVTTNTWHHTALVNNQASSAQGWLDGVVDGASFTFGNDATSRVINTLSDTADLLVAGGAVADLAIWRGVALSNAEIVSLSKGARPYTIREGNLVLWWPLDGIQSPEPDLSGNASNGTVNGTALAAGPPLMMFTPRWPQVLTAAISGSFLVFHNQTITIPLSVPITATVKVGV